MYIHTTCDVTHVRASYFCENALVDFFIIFFIIINHIARDDYFKMTFSSFIIFNHMYVYCELKRMFIENEIFGCPEKSKRLLF